MGLEFRLSALVLVIVARHCLANAAPQPLAPQLSGNSPTFDRVFTKNELAQSEADCVIFQADFESASPANNWTTEDLTSPGGWERPNCKGTTIIGCNI